MNEISFFLDDHDVVTCQNKILFGSMRMPSTFCAHELQRQVEIHTVEDIHEETFTCRVLCHGQPGWRSGTAKFRVVAEFQPDEPSPSNTLEELRMISSREE